MGSTTADGESTNATKKDDVKLTKGATIDDPEVTDGDVAAKQSAKPKRNCLGLFRGAAISVLSKVIETREDEVDAAQVKQTKNPKSCIKDSRSMSLEDAESSNIGHNPSTSTKSRRRSTDLGAVDQVLQNARRRKSTSDPDEIVRRPSLSSIVGIMTLRKMYIAKNQHSKKDSQQSTKPKLDLSEIKPEEMPEAPRFGATLSQEAQYATLSCYGDKVLNYLKTAGHSAWIRTSDRTQTPPGSDSLLFADQEGEPNNANTTLPSIDNPSRRQKTVATRGGQDAGNKQPKAKDLKVTHRLEYVMDILDKVKSTEGGITTTPRLRLKDMDPIQHAESWLLSWDTEFTVKDKESE